MDHDKDPDKDSLFWGFAPDLDKVIRSKTLLRTYRYYRIKTFEYLCRIIEPLNIHPATPPGDNEHN